MSTSLSTYNSFHSILYIAPSTDFAFTAYPCPSVSKILNSYAFALASIVIATKIMKIVMGKILIERIDKIWEKFNKKQLDK